MARSENLPGAGNFVPFDFLTYYDHEASLYNGGTPESFLIDSLSLDGILLFGQNVFAVQLHNVNNYSSDLSGNFYLTFGILDDSQFYSEPPYWFQAPIVYDETHLPIIMIENAKKQNILKINGTDKQQVGMVAAEIKSLRPPEPYKGKGIKEQGQYILRKEGKKK